MTIPQARIFTLGELEEGLRATLDFSVTPQEMQRFAELSGDFNPPHTDGAFARSKGLEGVVVYGALMVAKISQLIGMRLPGRDSMWASLAPDFRKPLYVDQPAQLEALVDAVSRSTGLVGLSLTIRVVGKVIAKGTAEVVVGPR